MFANVLDLAVNHMYLRTVEYHKRERREHRYIFEFQNMHAECIKICITELDDISQTKRNYYLTHKKIFYKFQDDDLYHYEKYINKGYNK